MPASEILKTVDSEEIEDILGSIARSFNVRFRTQDLSNVTTLGGISDLVARKIDGSECDDCTSQQAFYKLRKAIAEIQHIETLRITPATEFHSVLPSNKIYRLWKLERALGFKINELPGIRWFMGFSILIFLASFVVLFFEFKMGIAGLALSYFLMKLSALMDRKLNFKTVGLLAQHISVANYRNARRHSNTVNKKEILEKIICMFSERLGIEKSELTAEALLA